MRFESSKIAKIGHSQLNDMQLAFDIFDALDESVIEQIEKSNLYLCIYAEIFRDCLKHDCLKIGGDFSDEVEQLLRDTNYITTKIAEYERRFG